METAFLTSSALALLGSFEQLRITTSSFSTVGVSITVLRLIKTGVSVTSCSLFAATEAYEAGVENSLATASAYVWVEITPACDAEGFSIWQLLSGTIAVEYF